VKSNGGIFKAASYFEVLLDNHTVRFNVMPRERIGAHVAGFLGYIDSLLDQQSRKDDAKLAIAQTKTVLGMVSPCNFDENHSIWPALFKIADAYDGYVFAYDSVFLPSGSVIVGPLQADAVTSSRSTA